MNLLCTIFIMETLVRCLSNCYLDQTQSPHDQLDQKTEHGICLLNRCLVIISNMAATIPDARKDILKFKMMDLLSRAFQVQIIQVS